MIRYAIRAARLLPQAGPRTYYLKSTTTWTPRQVDAMTWPTRDCVDAFRERYPHIAGRVVRL